jgi:quercetin dioxygenase-like cupin family protein
VRRDGTERDAVRLVATDSFDVWLIGWPAHHRTTPPDHGASLGIVLVLEGELTEATNFATKELRVGDVTVIAPGAVHDVGTTESTALSLHLYSPPLTEMNFYD